MLRNLHTRATTISFGRVFIYHLIGFRDCLFEMLASFFLQQTFLIFCM